VQITPQLSANDIFYASALPFLLLIAVIWLARPAKAGDTAAAVMNRKLHGFTKAEAHELEGLLQRMLVND